MSAFVFMYVGRDTEIPAVLTKSLRLRNKDAQIIQCSDQDTPSVAGVDREFRPKGDPSKLMTFRLQCFAELALEETAMYLDVDMVCLRPLNPVWILGDADIGLCKREYGRSIIIEPMFKNLGLHEYEGKTVGDTWPYVACCTITRGAGFWRDCLGNLATLDEKFWRWYGDQEAMRNVAGMYKVRLLPESQYGHIPYEQNKSSAPRLLHFKGKDGKAPMLEYAKRSGLL